MAANGNDLQSFYAADLGRTYELAITNAASAQLSDAHGPLPPGRYLVQVLLAAGGKPSARCWIKFGKFVKGSDPVTATTAIPTFPVDPDGVYVFELNIKKGYNDRVAGIVAAAGANHTIYLTRIEREAAR